MGGSGRDVHDWRAARITHAARHLCHSSDPEPFTGNGCGTVEPGCARKHKYVAIRRYRPPGQYHLVLPIGRVAGDSEPFNSTESEIIEVTQTGSPQTVWQMNITGENAYRGYRIPSLYPGVTWQQ
jgi:hypothetical protein